MAALLIDAPVLGAQSLGSLAADRARLGEITGDTAHAAVPRDPSLAALVARIYRGQALDRIAVSVLRPEVRVTWNSTVPYSLNDGPLWASRGWNLSLNGGLALEQPYRGVMLRVVAAPTLLYSQNLPFQVFPNTVHQRSAYANPFHGPEASLDLPHRFGDRHLLQFDAGRSSVSVARPRFVVGATAENEWWGPGIRNALIISNNAPGIPRFFVRTGEPVRTPLGAFDAKLITGTLTQSIFFSPSANENRTLSGVLVQLRTAFDSTLTIGFSRVVYAPIGPEASPLTLTLARSLDAVVRWENLAGVGIQRSDQIGALFVRWVFAEAGLEVYGEWARMDLPRSATDLLLAPHHTGGWTFGFQWAQPKLRRSWLRLQSELTYLEQSRVFPDRPSPDFYSGQASPQGYTQRGQIIGAAIGPGASSQWIALDWLAPRWQVGGFVGRIRWDNDAMYRQQAPNFWDHDVSVLAGLRGGRRSPLTDFAVELSTARRFNYLFQNGKAHPGNFRTVDVNNVSLTLIVTPR